MSELPHSHELLSRDESRLLIIDMQKKILPVINGQETVLANCLKLIEAANILDVPTTATEQYPKGLGATVSAIAERIPDRPEKIEFSCLNCLDWNSSASDPESRFKVVVAGIESHVCVLQTVLDLLSQGFRVFVAADAVGSRKSQDREFALQRMASSGAVITTTESILFEWCERAGTPEFKEISRLVRD